MATALERFVYLIGADVDKKSFDQAQKGFDDLANIAKKLAKTVTATTAAIFGYTSIVNKANVENENLANSVGQNINTMEALGGEARKLGLDFDNVIDLAEEMQNKLGESAGLGEAITPVTESLQILGLTFEEIDKLSPEKQFETIIDAAIGLEDATNAAAAADILLGGEASKLIGSLNAQGKSLEEITSAYDEINFVTKESREGARLWTETMTPLFTIFKSIGSLFAGELGAALHSLIAEFKEFVLVNKEMISLGIGTLVDYIRISMELLFRTLRGIVSIMGTVVDMFGGFERVMRLIISAGIVLLVFKVVSAFIALNKVLTITQLIMAAIGKLPILLLFTGLVLLVEDLYTWINGGDSLMGAMFGDFDEVSAKVMGWWQSFTQFLSEIPAAAVEGFKIIGAAIFDFLVSPLNLVIETINAVIAGINLINPGDAIAKIPTLSAQSIFGGNEDEPQTSVFGGQAPMIEPDAVIQSANEIASYAGLGASNETLSPLSGAQSASSTLSPITNNTANSATTNNQNVQIDITTDNPVVAGEAAARYIERAELQLQTSTK